MLEMTARDIIPAVSEYISKLAHAVNEKKQLNPSLPTRCEGALIEKLASLLDKAYEAYQNLERAEKTAVGKKDVEDAAFYYKNTVESKMNALRQIVDDMEELCSREAWPMPTYGDIMFRV